MEWAKKIPKPRKLYFKPGSSLWLASHYSSMAFRRVQRGDEGLSIWGIIGLVLLLMIAAVPIAVLTFIGIRNGGDAAIAQIKIFATAFMAFFLVTGVSTSLMAMVENYTDRGDLDLLLTSPIKPHNIVLARLYSAVWRDLKLYSIIGLVVFTLPTFFISPKYLFFIPAVLGFSLILSSVSFLLGQWILQTFGPNLGRKITRGLGAILSLGWVIYLLFQKQISRNIATNSTPEFMDNLEKITWFGGAFAGDFVPALLLLAIGILIFAIVRQTSGDGFQKIAASLMGAPEEGPKQNLQTQKLNFKSGIIPTLVFKEWRVMRRDPMTFVQAFSPIIGLLPAMMQGFQSPDGHFQFTPLAYPSITAIAAGQLSLALAWVAVSLEDANDLIIVSPQPTKQIILGKTIAVILPGFLICSIFSMLCLFDSIRLALICFGFGILSVISGSLIEFLRPRPTKRVKLTQRPDRSMISVLVSMGLSISWAIGATMLSKHEKYWWAAALVGIVILTISILTSPKLKKHGLKKAFLHL